MPKNLFLTIFYKIETVQSKKNAMSIASFPLYTYIHINLCSSKVIIISHSMLKISQRLHDGTQDVYTRKGTSVSLIRISPFGSSKSGDFSTALFMQSHPMSKYLSRDNSKDTKTRKTLF